MLDGVARIPQASYNKGRGFVLIGHSQGALLLEQLIKEQIDPNPTLRNSSCRPCCSAATCWCPKGKLVGGTFQNVPACQRRTRRTA